MIAKGEGLSEMESRLNHIESHVNSGFDVSKLIHYVTNSLGDPDACIARLSDHALATAMLAWFRDNNLASLRQWSYVSGLLTILWYKRTKEKSSPFAKISELLCPLLSNNMDLIRDISFFDVVFHSERINQLATIDFLSYQSRLALQGKWDELGSRSEIALRNISGAMRRYEIDHRFYLALAEQDHRAISLAISDLVAPRNRAIRRNFESGFTKDLISTTAVIYSKMSWYHGIQIAIESSLIPKHWLPMTPLPIYKASYEFLK